mmetsp:Transcript_3675/g.2193  ORF Transcript_3675/g.2193 Transcript_3675/m.2193 type:complete len:82 (-) Transcript_3675:1062-1307(-)
MDLATISHLATLKCKVPFLHFFDGFRTSAELAKIEVVDYETMRQLYPYEDRRNNLREFALDSHNPIMRGTGQRPDVFMQAA